MVRIRVTRLSLVVGLVVALMGADAYAPPGGPPIVPGRTRSGPSSPWMLKHQIRRKQWQIVDLQQECGFATAVTRSRSHTLLSATDPDADSSDREDSAVATTSPTNNDDDGAEMGMITKLGTQAVLLLAAALIAYGLTTMAITNIIQFANAFTL